MKAVQQTLEHIDNASDRRRAAALDLNDIARLIHTRGGVQPASAAVDELVKLLFLVVAAERSPDLRASDGLLLSEAVRSDHVRTVDGLRDLKAAFSAANASPEFCCQLPDGRASQPIWASDESLRIDDSEVVADALTVLRSHATGGQTDLLGGAFDVFLSGRYEHAGGPGTHLTPHTVVAAMTQIGVAIADRMNGSMNGRQAHLMGDPCCGSGRFILAMADAQQRARSNHAHFYGAPLLVGADVSMASVAMTRVNLITCGLDQAMVFTTADSITDQALDHLRGRMRLILTNPPFGTAMYDNIEGIRRAAAIFPELAGRRRADPALVFAARCIDLLDEDGVGIAGIVLPDGVTGGKPMRDLFLGTARRPPRATLIGVVSLPVATFAPTGTTVKTSIVFLCKAVPPLPPQVFFARANHVGHVVRKGATIADPQGDDLPDIADDVCEIIAGRRPQGSKVEMSERSDLCSVIPAGGQRNPEAADRLRSIGGQPLSSMLRVAPKQRGPVASDAPFVSVLHVDALGCIDWQAAQQHHPTTAGVIATSGQVIVSLLNPAKFRASVIPDGHDQVQCSSEFGVFDPLIDPYAALALLQHPLVRKQVAPLGRGSSSSRRRINAGDLLGCIAPSYDPDEIDQMARPVREAMSAVAIGRSALAKAFST